MSSLAGKVALVTGAGQGIGRGIALALAREGAAVAVAGRTLEKLTGVSGEVTARGGRAVPVPVDLQSPEQISEAVERTRDALGAVDLLVNNAQEFCFGHLAGLTIEEIEAGWRSGPMAALRLMQACREDLAGGGAVVNIGSSAALSPPAGVAGYAAVKAALHVLTRAAATEWAGDGIRVNLVIPLALTPPMEGAFAAHPEMEAQILSTVPLGRIGDPEGDIGRAVVFLCGPDAGYITGTTLCVDGGEAFLR